MGGLYELILSDNVNYAEAVCPEPTNQTNHTNQTIPNQYVVMLENNTTDKALKALINEVQNKGAQIIGAYPELFKGFSFRAPDNQTAEKVLSQLHQNPLVESVTPDREVSIQPGGVGVG